MGWTDESVEKLRQLWAQGMTANEIAKKLGVTKNAIVGKVHRLCLTARPSPIKPKDMIPEALPEEPVEVVEKVAEPVTEKPAETSKEKPAGASTNVTLVDLDSHTCRWPIGDPRDDDFCFCGKKVRSGQTYCDEHSVQAYVKALKK